MVNPNHPRETFHPDGTATIVRESPFSHTLNSLTMKLTKEQFDRWMDGELIQNALPHLNADEREFLMTGITAKEWDDEFGDEDS